MYSTEFIFLLVHKTAYASMYVHMVQNIPESILGRILNDHETPLTAVQVVLAHAKHMLTLLKMCTQHGVPTVTHISVTHIGGYRVDDHVFDGEQ